jgi:hypothetical protein
MSNLLVNGWEHLEHGLLHRIEFASNCAGPDGAKERVKHAVVAFIKELRELALAEAEKVLPVAEEAGKEAVDTALKSAAPVIEEKLGEPAGSVVEAGLAEVAAAGEHIVVDELAHVANEVEAPVVEAPVVEAPVVEAPVVEAPVVEAPAVESAETETK